MSTKRVVSAVVVAVIVSASGVFATFGPKFTVKPWVFDPAGSYLVASGWGAGAGCVTKQAFDDVTYGPGIPPSPFMEPACPTGDPWDKQNEGLGLIKTGPTYNNASAGATVTGVWGIWLKQLGYDVRKPVAVTPDLNDPRGSHCGNGGPRFNVITKPSLGYPSGILYFVGCNYPPSVISGAPGGGYIRVRWGDGVTVGSVVGVGYDLFANAYLNGGLPLPITQQIKSIDLVQDEGQDTGPDNFGVSILDNIDINGVLVGRNYSW
jgi:hypothetical protein